jgi:hypothetical protein
MAWVFGPEFPGHATKVEMKELRGFDVPTRARAFKARTEAFFLKQVDTFGTPSPWAPFPLAVMTCVGIEMIGSYKYGDAPGDNNGHFKKFVEDMDAKFAEIKPTPDGSPRSLSHFLYQGFRNSLAHGFYGKWVFTTHERSEAATFKYNLSKRFVVVNVYWLYERFRDECQRYLGDLAGAVDPNADPLKTFNKTFEKNFALWV